MTPRLLLTLSLVLLAVRPASAQDFSEVTIKTTSVAGSISMLEGEGGNIGVLVGPDGVLLVDDEYAPLASKIASAVKQLSPKPVRFIVNTHCHHDHVGGNEAFGTEGAVIVAQDNVRKRMSTEQFIAFAKRTVPPYPAVALPILTFADSVSFHLDGEDVDVLHVAAAHTDGDSLVFFKKANVVHMGDVLFNGRYPFIDYSSGGSIDGVLAAADLVLSRVDDKTRLIPGHGPLASKADLQKYRDMLATIRDRIQKAVADGKTLDQTVALKPTAEFDAAWGAGSLKPDVFVALLYSGLKH